jgi:hypothetical protein
MIFHIEVLDDAQKTLLPILGEFATERGFYLGGGTAVALYLGHRRSVDFDWFTAGALGDPLILAQQARESGLQIMGSDTGQRTLHATINGVRVSFMEYHYPLLGDPADWPDYSARLASLDDLACMKLAAVGQRGLRRDFIDLHAIALQHRPLSEIVGLCRRKYSASDISHLLVGLTYFDDAEDEPMPSMLSAVDWEEVKRQFRQWAKELAA